MNIKVRECFLNAKKDEEKGKKHKGLLVIEPNHEQALEYMGKVKRNLLWCEKYKEEGDDYKLPEEWFYTLYYCALAILSKFGVETRSQKCTASFLRYVKDKGLIKYDDEFIDRITVYSDKKLKSDVDDREDARYSSSVKSEDVIKKYDMMMNVCKRCITQCEEIIFSNDKFEVPKELLE